METAEQQHQQMTSDWSNETEQRSSFATTLLQDVNTYTIIISSSSTWVTSHLYLTHSLIWASIKNVKQK